VSTLIISCKKDNIIPNEVKKDNIVSASESKDNVLVQKLIELGFAESNIVEYDDYFLVEGDISISKSELNLITSNKQARTNFLVSASNQTIRVFLNTNFGTLNTQMSSAVDDALYHYNLSGSSLDFIRVYNSSQADIIVSEDGSIGSNVCGIAGFPTYNGEPYSSVRINESLLTSFNHNQIVDLVIHELGHCIGFRHTNWSTSKEPWAIQIEGTHLEDTESVMNGGNCGAEWSSFSFYDFAAINYLYPQISYTQLGGANWQTGISDMTSLNGWLYIIENGRLYRASSSNGRYTQLGGVNWQTGVIMMTSLNGWLYVIENSRLYRVNPNDGSYTQLGGANWQRGVKGMTALNGWIYLVENSRLYKVNPNDGSYTQLGGVNWQAGVKAMTSLNGWIYLIENNRLYKVNANDGSYTQLGSNSWTVNVRGITSLNGLLYVVENSRIHEVQPSTGVYEIISAPIWTSADGVTSLNNKLHMVESSRLYGISRL
jgi:hypothetical protein